MVNLDRVVALPPKSLKDLARNPDDLGVREHGVVGAGNVKVALVEFPHPSFGHGRLISPVDLGDVVAFDVLDGAVHGEPTSEWDCEVVP